MEKHLKTANFLAKLLDSRFNFLGIRFGLDPLLGLVPGLGEVVTVLMSLYIVWIGVRIGIPQIRIYQMLGNILLDFLVGVIPVIGDIFDIFYKSNIRNLDILNKYRHQKIIDGELVR